MSLKMAHFEAFAKIPGTIGNQLLAHVPASDMALLRPHFHEVRFGRGEVISSPGRGATNVYFIQSGLASIISVLGGTMVEACAIGREGAINLVSAMGSGRSITQSMMQVEGDTLCIDTTLWRDVVRGSESLRDLTARYTQALLAQALQSVACNARHSVEARFSRKLLACRDRTGSSRIRLTQQFLADMLGVQRTTLAATAAGMQKAGLIRYRHGVIEILDIEGIRKRSCECYGAIRAMFETLLPETFVSPKP